MRWGRRGKITPRSPISGLLRHTYDTTFAAGIGPAITRHGATCPAGHCRPLSPSGLIAANLPLA
jgi:hypothetical protein